MAPTPPADPSFDRSGAAAIPVHAVTPGGLDDWLKAAPAAQQAWVKAQGFKAGPGQVLALPGDDGNVAAALVGLGNPQDARRGRLWLGDAPVRLPAGLYTLASGLDGAALDQGALAWLLGSYRFGRYKETPPAPARLAPPEGANSERIEAIAIGAALAQRLIDTPASDLGPAELQAAAEALGEAHGACVATITGQDLLTQNFPMIHAVGRASDKAPRLIELAWGSDGPAVTLVGKGVCFDTGGLNLKPGASMGLMKKDMGGAANTLGLASMIMALKLPVRLRVLIPAVENSVSAGAFRPQDVLTARNGKTVEVNNTDAEGRLVLADALALACEDPPDLLVSLATLTGAARVAVGPDLVPFYTDDDALAGQLSDAAAAVEDPLWRLPFWDPYEEMIEPDVAELDNAPKGGFAGSITAALFLRRFVTGAGAYAHFDLFGWTPAAKPGRPKGGACQAARALLEVIEART